MNSSEPTDKAKFCIIDLRQWCSYMYEFAFFLSLSLILIRRHLCVDFTAASHSAFSHVRIVCSVASAPMYLQNSIQIHTLAKT